MGYHILSRMENEIVFEGVSFRYPDGEADIFTGLDLTLPRGIVSLVGQNGTGKSTLLLLASGRLLPTRGRSSYAVVIRVSLRTRRKDRSWSPSSTRTWSSTPRNQSARF